MFIIHSCIEITDAVADVHAENCNKINCIYTGYTRCKAVVASFILLHARAGCITIYSTPFNCRVGRDDQGFQYTVHMKSAISMCSVNFGPIAAKGKIHELFMGPFHGDIAVPSVTRCRCRSRCGHRLRYIAVAGVLLTTLVTTM